MSSIYSSCTLSLRHFLKIVWASLASDSVIFSMLAWVARLVSESFSAEVLLKRLQMFCSVIFPAWLLLLRSFILAHSLLLFSSYSVVCSTRLCFIRLSNFFMFGRFLSISLPIFWSKIVIGSTSDIELMYDWCRFDFDICSTISSESRFALCLTNFSMRGLLLFTIISLILPF